MSRSCPTFVAVHAGRISGGSLLLPGRRLPEAGSLTWADGVITTVEQGAEVGRGHDDPTIDASGALVVPGIVDLHGDAFERSLMPRGGVPIDVDTALADNDVQLLAAGITTSFLSATDSWEPGLRSRRVLRDLVAGLGRRRGGPAVELHVRHECCNTDDAPELEQWIETGAVRLLSFNDHTPGGIAMITGISPKQVERAGVDQSALEDLLAEAVARRPQGKAQEERLAAVARGAGCALASHDASSAEDLARDRHLGVAIAEFPASIELARDYRAHGFEVLLGAPNLVRGASHLGNLSVRDAICAGIASIICSDYHYPSLLQAPFVLEREGILPIGDAWAFVSERAAAAAGLVDRGRLAAGARADILVVEPAGAAPARVRAVVVAGRKVFEAP